MNRPITALTLTLALASPAAAATAEQRCQQALSVAASKYLSCMQTSMGKRLGGGGDESFRLTSGRCAARYAGTWTKLAARNAGLGTSCEGSRYAVNGDGTFHDRLTRLTWEMKTDDGTVHDKDEAFTWSIGDPWKETGTAFTMLLQSLNQASFGGSSGWRLPSIYELYTLVEPAYPHCVSGPCTTVPGEVSSDMYWSCSTAGGAGGGATFWGSGGDGGASANAAAVVSDSATASHAVRAVRGGS